jgi:hypothetical protein
MPKKKTGSRKHAKSEIKPHLKLFPKSYIVAAVLVATIATGASLYFWWPWNPPPNGHGSLSVKGYYGGSPVGNWQAYYVDSSGHQGSTVTVPVNGYTWSNLAPGSYTLHGSYNTLVDSKSATVTADQTTFITVNFGSSNPPGTLTFTKYAYNPVMGPTLSWEGTVVGEPTILYEGGVFKMWYRGNVGANSALGYATSSDAHTWTKDPSAPFITGYAYPVVIKVSGLYYLFQVSMSNDRLYRWSSTDGRSWSINNNGNAILSPTAGTWDDRSICNVAVYYDASGTPAWRMLYEAKGYSNGIFQIGYAYSSDGLSWTKRSSPVLPNGVGSEAGNPGEILFINGKYHLWTGIVVGGWKIYHTTTTDFNTWSTPQLAIGTGLAWEGTHVADPSVGYGPGGRLYMLYNGGQNQQGLALEDLAAG